jgi:glutamine cyclotransferase|tara:strand:- start:277 stop:441 length:165 start_codon:yes stop_codon:yes gene_type:complete
MKKKNLKTLINDLEVAIAELKAEVYSDTSAYRISNDSDKTTSYLDINDEDGLCD